MNYTDYIRQRCVSITALTVVTGSLVLLLLPSTANGARRQQGPIGSLTTSGTVYVNGNPAPDESTLFPGDVVKTGNDGTAISTLSGKGSFKLAPNSQLTFSGQQYVAELESGTVVMDSFGGTTDMTMRVGPYILAPVIATAASSSSKVAKAPDGSFTIVCLDGSVGLVPIQGTLGRVLGANQSVAISSQGELGATQEVSQNVNPAPSTSSPHTQNSHKGWIILGVAGGGAAGIGAAIAAAGHGGSSSQAVSPSSP